MPPTAVDRASAPFLAALESCTDHLSADEVLEIFRNRAGEAELNDLLRHAVNRLVRPQWLVEREISDRAHGLTRVDLAMRDFGSLAPFAWVEAKVKYATDAVEAPEVFIGGGNSIEKDAHKLAASKVPTPCFLLTWVPYVTHSVRRLRYGAGHDVSDDGFRVRLGLDDCRAACAQLLGRFGDTRLVEVMTGVGDFGALTLDAWWTPVAQLARR